MEPKRILVGIDEGDLARHAVARGLELAKRFDSKIEFVHCIPLESEAWAAAAAVDWYALRTDVIGERRKRVFSRLKEWVGTMPPGMTSIEDSFVVLDQKPNRALAKYALEKEVDLIVLGGHAKTGFFDFGGTARSLLHHAPCAVWTQPTEPADVKTILAPVAPEEMTAASLDWLRSIATSSDAKLILLNVFEPPAFAYEPLHAATDTLSIRMWRENIEKRFRAFTEETDWGVALEAKFVEGDPVTEVLEASEGADLIVMGTHARGAIERAVLGSVAYGVLKGAKIPTLLVPNRTEERLLSASEESAGAQS